MEKPVILSVDDDAEVLRAVVRDLRKRYAKDYRILRAESGSEALAALTELKDRREPVALLLSDQRMPQLDGVAFLGQAMRLHPTAKRVLLTAYADTEAAIAAINKSRIDHYLMKPWDPADERLYPVLDDLLEDWRANFRPGYGGIRVAGTRWSPGSFAVKDFLARNHVPYQFLDIETSEEGRQLLEQHHTDRTRMPLVEIPGGRVLIAPSTAELAAAVGLRGQAEQPFYDLTIVGGGPAGLAAAVYAASEGLRTVLVEREAPGGQAGTSSRIENYLGFPSGLSGADLARRALAQAKRFGVEVLTPQEAVALDIDGPYKILKMADGSSLSSHLLMLSMGVSWRKLEAAGAGEFAGRGVYYGAALVEALNCRDEDVFVVGAGNSAGQAAIYFAQYACKVVMLVRGDSLGAKMSQYLVDRIHATANIEVRLRSEVAACHGDEHLEALTIRDYATRCERQEPAKSLFVFIGAAPHTDWLGATIARDRQGFILTGPDLDRGAHLAGWPLERAPFLLEANVPGVFASGDVRSSSVKRVASAVGEGSVAVHFMHRHLASL